MFKSMYTDLLREAMRCADKYEGQDWRELKRECRKELYRMHNKIDHIAAKCSAERHYYGKNNQIAKIKLDKK